MKYLSLIFISIVLLGCKRRTFETPDQFKQWVAGKTFTSVGNDLDQWNSQGAYASPVGTLELKFNGDQMTYQNCYPDTYNVYQDIESGNWIVGFNSCNPSDSFELVVPSSGDIYVQGMDYDTSRMLQGSSTNVYERLDAIAHKRVVRGPTMEITDEHSVTLPINEPQGTPMKKMDDTNQKAHSVATVKKIQISDTLTQKPKIRNGNPLYVVNSDKAYFYNRAGYLASFRNAYLVQGDTIEAKLDSFGFVYCEFKNSITKKTSKGWILKQFLKIAN